MTQEEIKSKLALTDEQKSIVDQLNKLIKKAKEKNVGIVFDYAIDALSFTAFNNSEVLEMDNIEELNDSENAVDIEDCLTWGNLFNGDIYIYDNYYGHLHAVFGDKTTLNESMMSAAL